MPNHPDDSKAATNSASAPSQDLLGATQVKRFRFSDYSGDQLMQAIRAVEVNEHDEKLPKVKLVGADQQHNLLMRFDHPVQLNVEGSMGDYAFAFSANADIRISGSAGHGVAEGMISGNVRVRGDAGVGAGTAMTGGTLAIYGSAGDRCGAAMRGGGIFVRGNVGDEAAVGALRGILVIGGDAGENLGDAMSSVTVFIRGNAKSLAPGVTEAPLRKREQLRLGLLLINASIRGDAKEFRRIVPEAMLQAEQSQRGELNPKWR